MKIILVEGKKDVELCLKNKQLSQFQIISFDFLAHKELKKKNIPHKMIEDYFEKREHEELDLKVLNVATNWYKQKVCQNLLEFKNVNFGELFIQKGVEYFFPVLKRVTGIIKILTMENPNTILGYSLKNYISTLSKNKKIIENVNVENSFKIMGETHYDIPIKIGSKTKWLKIKRGRYDTIKKITESLTNLIFQVNYNFNSKNENILLLEFNPTTYYNLLESLSKTSKNIILLNQRRPAIWNKNSLNIVKKFNCKVIQLEKFMTNEIDFEIKNKIKLIENNLEKLWSNSEFKKYFIINEYSYWNIINEDLKNILISRNRDIIKKYYLLEKIFGTIKIKLVLEWSHVGMEESIVLSQSEKQRIPTISLQHGMFLENEKFEKYQPMLTFLPPKNVKIAVWGDIIQNYIKKHNINEENLLTVGSPKHDDYFKVEKKQIKKMKTVLILENGFFHPSFDGSDSRSFDYLEKCIREIFQSLKQFEDINIIVKLHPGTTYYNISELVNEISPETPIYKSEDIFSILKKSDVVIALNYSTAILDAMILQKPTMYILTEKQDYEKESMLQKNATLVVKDFNMIKNNIKKILNDKIMIDNLIEKSDQYVKEYFVNPGISSDVLKDILDK